MDGAAGHENGSQKTDEPFSPSSHTNASLVRFCAFLQLVKVHWHIRVQDFFFAKTHFVLQIWAQDFHKRRNQPVWISFHSV